MNIISIMTATAIALVPLAAIADNIDEPIVPTIAPVMSAPAAMDWSGAYVGLGYGSVTGDVDFTNPDIPAELNDGTLTQLFGGYQIQRGALVYGGEIAFGSGSGTTLPCCVGVSEVSDQMIDLKGRVGYATGSLLVYGVLGYSMGEYDDIIGTPGEQSDISGLNYGIGVDYAFTNNWIVGAEYLVRDLDGDNPTSGGGTVQVDYDSISLRVAYKF
jgi:outer membrane immunogenic protein